MSGDASQAPCACKNQVRLGPYLFTFRTQPSGQVVTVPALLVPLQWPPSDIGIRTPPDAAFVYTTFGTPAVQPVGAAPSTLVSQLGWGTHGVDDGGGLAQGPPSTRQPVSSMSTVVGDRAPPSSLAEEGEAMSTSTSRLNKPTPAIAASSAESRKRPRMVSYDESDFVPVPESPSELATDKETGAQEPVTGHVTVAPKFKRKALPGEWTRGADPSIPFPVTHVDDESPSPPYQRPTSAASPATGLRRRPTNTLRCTPSPTPNGPPAPIPATPQSSMQTKSLDCLRPGLSEHREVARLLTIETRPAPTPPRSSGALQEVTGTVVNGSGVPRRPPRHPLRGFVPPFRTIAETSVPDPLWFTTYPGPKHSQKCFNLSALAKTPEGTPPITPAEDAKLQHQQAAASFKRGKTLAEVAKEPWNHDRSHSTTFYTATGSDHVMSAFPSTTSNLIADPVTPSVNAQNAAGLLSALRASASSLFADLVTNGTDPRPSPSSSVSVHRSPVEFSCMQEAVAVLAEMLQHSLHITEYLDEQMNQPLEDESMEVDEKIDEEIDQEVDEEVDELDSSTQDGDPDDSVNDSPPAAPTESTGGRRPNSDTDDAFDQSLGLRPSNSPAFARTLSYRAPEGYTHIDDTTLTSIPEEDIDSLTSFDSTTSSSPEASPSRSSPQRPLAFTTPRYHHGGSLPTIAEVLEERTDASPNLSHKLSAVSLYSQDSSQSEF